MHLPAEEPLWILALCTVPAAPGPATANLLSPIGVGTVSNRGAQIVLHDSRWSDSTPLPS
ncbi:MAG: flagellar assembly protein FliW [Deltaproteobacteria bacterium]|nr:flagellar assembly protein FliW [Deltaproteobacteria bacterium]